MKIHRLRFLLMGVTAATVLYGAVALLTPTEALAESGTCCSTSADCAGTMLCYTPGNLAPCSVLVPNYCFDRGPAEELD